MATASFTSSSGGVTTRHVQATFKFTNTSGQTLKNLVFLPVITADTDGDPTNNAQTPTVTGTPFRDVQYFDGSDASGQVNSLVLAQGQILNVTTGAAEQDTSASFFTKNLDSSGLSATPPAGLSTTVMNSGWMAADSLAPGTSTNVTFAVDIPGVNPALPKTQPYSFNLLLTGAQDPTASTTGAVVDPARIQGVINNWSFSGGTLKSAFYGNYLLERPGLLSDSISPGGTIDAGLPTPKTLESLLTGCTFTGTQSAGDLKYAAAAFFVYSVQNDLLGRLQESTLDGQLVTRIYSDSTAQFQGTAACPYNASLDLDLKVVRGWNDVFITFTPGTPEVIRYKSVSLGSRTTYTLDKSPEKVEMIFNDTSPISLKPGESVARGVTINQVGGIQGNTTFETDVPGISVTPASVGLSPLAVPAASDSVSKVPASQLQPLSLMQTLTFTATANARSFAGSMNVLAKKNGQEVGRTTLNNVSIVAPSITTGYRPSFMLARGETQQIHLAVYSQNGFSGTTTLTLDHLPAGLTADPTTVTLTPGATAEAVFTVVVPVSSVLGTTQNVGISGPDLQGGFVLNGEATVLPERVVVGTNGITAVAPAVGGIWVLSGTSVNRVEGHNIVQSVPFAQSSYANLLATPSGEAMLVTMNSTGSSTTSSLTLIGTTGAKSTLNFPTAPFYRFMYNPSSGAVDFNNNLWFISSNGYLSRVNTSDGSISEFSSTLLPTDASVVSSPDGKTLQIFSSYDYNANIFTVDIATGSIQSKALGSGFAYTQALYTDNNGSIYLKAYNGISRIMRDGTVTFFSLQNNANVSYFSTTVLGLDRVNPNILWLVTDGNVGKLNLTTSEVVSTRFGDNTSQQRGTPSFEGGVWVTSYTSMYTPTYTSTHYASYIP